MLNNLKMKFSHWKVNLIFSFYFLFLTIIREAISHEPTYIDNLNWFCQDDFHFLYENQDSGIIKKGGLLVNSCNSNQT